MNYKIGDKVWIKPIDYSDLEGVIIGFTYINNKPIVEFKMFGNPDFAVFDYCRINLYKNGKVKNFDINIIKEIIKINNKEIVL